MTNIQDVLEILEKRVDKASGNQIEYKNKLLVIDAIIRGMQNRFNKKQLTKQDISDVKTISNWITAIINCEIRQLKKSDGI